MQQFKNLSKGFFFLKSSRYFIQVYLEGLQTMCGRPGHQSCGTQWPRSQVRCRWPSLAVSHSISQPGLVHTAQFSFHLLAVFSKSPLGNRCDAKSRVVPDQALIEFKWSPGTLCLHPGFSF